MFRDSLLAHQLAMVLSCATLIACSLLACGASGDDISAEQSEFFEKKIRPVLVEHCYSCHSPDAAANGGIKGGLLLHSRDATRRGGDSGPAVVPGKLGESLLIDALRYESFEMPPAGKLPQAVIADFERWVAMGAPDPRDETSGGMAPREVDVAKGRDFWSFQPPTRKPLPGLKQAHWPQRTIDHFVLAQVESHDLRPAEAASRQTLLRRASFDLTGLPPTPEQAAAFLADESPQAYERLVEELLASPHYGERWARVWLDVARYAEDQAHIVGKNSSLFYPNAYLYRDWVIGALNEDMPYDQFVRLQLAADLILEAEEPKTEAEELAKSDKDLAALGFIGLGPKYYRRNSLAVMADEWEDRVDTVSRGLLGLTVACARCHDHKFDPIRTEDYYALAGVFASTEMFNRPLAGRKAEKNGHTKAPKDAMHIIREKKPQDLTVFIRGDVGSKGDVVKRRFLEVLSPADGAVPFRNGSGRLELADAIVNRDNPLTARVLVNRVWSQHFGQPLVATSSNFGALGQEPTHPDLLDDLAVRFMEAGWSLKWLHREIVLSSTYQQSSVAEAEFVTADPANQWLSRMNRKRLSVEAWRDSLLAANGLLNRSIGGPSMDPQDPKSVRRTVYSRISRLDLNPMLALFDFPDPNAHAAGRAKTITALQKLFVLNSPFMVAQAEAFVDRLFQETEQHEAKDRQRNRIRRAYQLLFAREPLPAELQAGKRFLGDDAKSARDNWRQYAQVLFAANEMTYID